MKGSFVKCVHKAHWVIPSIHIECIGSTKNDSRKNAFQGRNSTENKTTGAITYRYAEIMET
jgi:hypothetical protein